MSTNILLFLIGAHRLSERMLLETGAEYPADLYCSNTVPLERAIVQGVVESCQEDSRVFVYSIRGPELTSSEPSEDNLSVTKINHDLVQNPVLASWETLTLGAESKSLEFTYEKIKQLLRTHSSREYPLPPTEKTVVIVHDADILLRGIISRLDTSQKQTAFVFGFTDELELTSGSQFLKLKGEEPLAYAGAVAFNSSDEFLACLERAKAQDSENQDFLPRVLAEASLQVVPFKDFLDFGNIENYYRSRMLCFSAREFHNIQVDLTTGTLTKSGGRSAAHGNQAKWFKALPEKLKHWLPPVYDIEPNEADPSQVNIRMGLFPFPSLADHLIHHTLSYQDWCRVAVKLRNLLEEFRQVDYDSKLSRIRLPAKTKTMYLSKTRERLERFERQMTDTEEWGSLKTSISTMRSLAGSYVLRHRLETCSDVSIIHGDLCFSNILYDPKSTQLKVIDPRGSFFEYSDFQSIDPEFFEQPFYGVDPIKYLRHLTGDPAYEFAKIRQSLSGYDLILAGRYTVVHEDGLFKPRFYASDVEQLYRVHSAFLKVFNPPVMPDLESDRDRRKPSSHIPHNLLLRRADAIEPLLYLSLLPLHYEDKFRQRVLASHAVTRFNRMYTGS